MPRPALVWQAPAPVLIASSAPCGGGVGLRSWVVNAEVPKDYDRVDLDAHGRELRDELRLDGEGVVLLTAASVEAHTTATDDGVDVTATVGLTWPTWAAAAGAPVPYAAGTVNVVAWVPVTLSPGALLGAVATATEAKVQALLEAGVDGTGTASDAIAVACPARGQPEPFAGVRSRWGAPLARAVHAAVRQGC